MRRENSVTSNVKQSPDIVAHNIVTTLTELSLLRNTERGITNVLVGTKLVPMP